MGGVPDVQPSLLRSALSWPHALPAVRSRAEPKPTTIRLRSKAVPPQTVLRELLKKIKTAWPGSGVPHRTRSAEQKARHPGSVSVRAGGSAPSNHRQLDQPSLTRSANHHRFLAPSARLAGPELEFHTFEPRKGQQSRAGASTALAVNPLCSFPRPFTSLENGPIFDLSRHLIQDTPPSSFPAYTGHPTLLISRIYGTPIQGGETISPFLRVTTRKTEPANTPRAQAP